MPLAVAFAVLLCASLSIAAEFVPTVKLEDGQAVTTSGLPLYGFARFMQPTLDLAGEWRRWKVAADNDLTLAARWRETVRRLEEEGRGCHDPGFDDSGWETVQVPSVLAAPPEIYEGTAWFRRAFEGSPEPGRRWLLRFEGAGYMTDVWVNGVWIGAHEGTYTPFTFDITPHLRQHNALVVRIAVVAQGSRNDVVPYAKCDFWNYGGIMRGVSLARVPDTHIASVRASGGLDGQLHIRTTVRAAGDGHDGQLRLELLGLSMIPQHSDARILDQLIYKWKHSRAILANVLTDKYVDLAATGWRVTAEAIADDVERLVARNFTDFVGRRV